MGQTKVNKNIRFLLMKCHECGLVVDIEEVDIDNVELADPSQEIVLKKPNEVYYNIYKTLILDYIGFHL